jgi:pimeloyl-ACP methyl ester carboxylesterase
VSPAPATHYAVLPGAGSAGLAWRTVAELLGANVLPLGDELDVDALADGLRAAIASIERPRVIVGASLGAMVALEVARGTPVDGLVLIAAGFGITVSDSLLQWVASSPPDLLEKLARIGLADPGNERHVAIREADFAARGGARALLGHLRALAGYRPEPLADPPAAIVLWGEHDRGIPLRDHAELASRLGGLLVPIASAGHAPFLEQPEQTVRWIKCAALWTGSDLN